MWALKGESWGVVSGALTRNAPVSVEGAATGRNRRGSAYPLERCTPYGGGGPSAATESRLAPTPRRSRALRASMRWCGRGPRSCGSRPGSCRKVNASTEWPHSSIHRYIQSGLLPPDWGTATVSVDGDCIAIAIGITVCSPLTLPPCLSDRPRRAPDGATHP